MEPFPTLQTDLKVISVLLNEVIRNIAPELFWIDLISSGKSLYHFSLQLLFSVFRSAINCMLQCCSDPPEGLIEMQLKHLLDDLHLVGIVVLVPELLHSKQHAFRHINFG